MTAETTNPAPLFSARYPNIRVGRRDTSNPPCLATFSVSHTGVEVVNLVIRGRHIGVRDGRVHMPESLSALIARPYRTSGRGSTSGVMRRRRFNKRFGHMLAEKLHENDGTISDDEVEIIMDDCDLGWGSMSQKLQGRLAELGVEMAECDLCNQGGLRAPMQDLYRSTLRRSVGLVCPRCIDDGSAREVGDRGSTYLVHEDNVVWLEDLGEWAHESTDYYIGESGNRYSSYEAACDAGDVPHDDDDDGGVINPYGGAAFKVGRFGDGRDPMTIGVEFEIELHHRAGRRDVAEDVLACLDSAGVRAAMDSDGSLDHGFEVVFGWAALSDWQAKMPAICRVLDHRYRQESAGAGTHINVAVSEHFAARVLITEFVNRRGNGAFIDAIAGRSETGYCKRVDGRVVPTTDHCVAVNFGDTNGGRGNLMSLRIFLADPAALMIQIEFTHALCALACDRSLAIEQLAACGGSCDDEQRVAVVTHNRIKRSVLAEYALRRRDQYPAFVAWLTANKFINNLTRVRAEMA